MKDRLFKIGYGKRLGAMFLAITLILTLFPTIEAKAAAYSGSKKIGGIDVSFTGNSWFESVPD